MLTPESSRAARGLLDWTLKDLASKSGVSFTTISAFESGRPSYASTRKLLEAAFQREGIELIRDEARIGATILAVQQQDDTAPTGPLERIFRERARQEAAPVKGRPRRTLTDGRP
jgi:transcriptional regulator with XRE-family HTH domain